MNLGRLSILVTILIISASLAFAFLTGRVWWRSSKYSVTVNSESVMDAPVYAGRGVILVDLRLTGDEAYLIYPTEKELGRAQKRRFTWLPFCIISHQKPAIYIPIAKIIETPTHEEFGPDFVRFLSAERKLVVVHWQRE